MISSPTGRAGKRRATKTLLKENTHTRTQKPAEDPGHTNYIRKRVHRAKHDAASSFGRARLRETSALAPSRLVNYPLEQRALSLAPLEGHVDVVQGRLASRYAVLLGFSARSPSLPFPSVLGNRKARAAHRLVNTPRLPAKAVRWHIGLVRKEKTGT